MTPLRVLRKPMPLVMAIRLSLLAARGAWSLSPHWRQTQFDIAAGDLDSATEPVRRPQRHYALRRMLA
ncbi:Uncharacterised protein [Raoultella ornithinolytica]|nr:Uncharacterised protein [Raoultella ornithinolytica]